MIASLSIAELALSGLAGFLLAMLAVRPVQRRLYRSLRRAHWTLRTLPEWCAFALYVDAAAEQRRVRDVYARLIDQGNTEDTHTGRPFPRDVGGQLVNPVPDPYQVAVNNSSWTIRVYRATSCLSVEESAR